MEMPNKLYTLKLYIFLGLVHIFWRKLLSSNYYFASQINNEIPITYKKNLVNKKK